MLISCDSGVSYGNSQVVVFKHAPAMHLNIIIYVKTKKQAQWSKSEIKIDHLNTWEL